MASGPGKTPEERAAADPTSEVESSRGLMSALGVTKARASAPPPQTAAPAFVLQPSFTASMSFLDAVAADNMEVVTRFVDQATKSAEEVEGGAGGACTPSSSAARHALLNQDSSGNLQGFTPWLMAAWKGADTALRWLAAQPEVDTDTRTANAMGAHAMHLAVIGGHFRVLHFLLSLPGADADVRDKQGCTPLIVAAQYGEVLCAHLLLRRGASPMAADECGDTPLHWAAYKGHEDLVILFATGAVRPLRPVRAVRPTGGLAIHCLIHLAPPAHPQRAPDVVLTDACPPLGINTPGVSVCVHGGGAVHDIVTGVGGGLGSVGGVPMVHSVDHADNFGQTPLHIACLRATVPVVRRLIELGASPLSKDEKGKRPADVAREKGHSLVLHILEPSWRSRLKFVGACVYACILRCAHIRGGAS